MNPLGLRYARGHILFGERRAAALYRLGMTSYSHLSAADKWALQARLERFAHLVGADFSVWRVSRGYPAETYRQSLASRLDRRGQPSPGAWEAFLAEHEDAVRGLGSHTAEVYVAVELRSAGSGRDLGRSLARAAGFARRAAHGQRHPIAASRVRALAETEQQTYDRLRQVLPLRPATTRELEWLLRRSPLRGVSEPLCDRHWEPDALVIDTDGEVVYEPLETDVLRLVRDPMREAPHADPTLVVELEAGRSHQAFLTVGALADEPAFPGALAELMHAPIEGVGFPVDVTLHARWLGNREALAQIRRRVIDAEQVYREQLESQYGPAWSADDDRSLAREYESELQGGGRPPMLYASLTAAVGAATREECDRRVALLRERFGDIVLHRPRGLQERLFFDGCVGADGGRVGDYVQQMSAEQFGALVPTATTEAGDRDGVYIGYSMSAARRPVRFDITSAPREDRTTAVVCAGALGAGKTMAALQLAVGAERRGSLIVDFDPRPDHGWERLPWLAGRVEAIDLAGGRSQAGKLDPLVVAPEELREDLASSYLLELLRDPPASWETAIQRAVRDVVRDGGRGCLAVIERLRGLEGDAARDVADALEVVSEFGLGQLGFGDGSTRPATAVKAVTTIRTPGLVLPEAGVPRESYSRQERVSVATLSLVAALAVRLVMDDPSRHKVVLLDEAWFLLGSGPGRSLLNRLIRLARRFNATTVLVTHRLGDLGELRELIGTWFIFGQDGSEEARTALEQIGVQPTDAHVAELRDPGRQGRCLIRDLHGRIASMQFDPGSLLGPLSTTPETPEASA